MDTLFVIIALMGDLLPGNTLKELYPPDSGYILFKKVIRFIEDADLSFANFEAAFEGGVERRKKFVFSAPLSALGGIKKSGIKGFSIANNHIFDLGKKGAYRTFKILKKSGFVVSGLKNTWDSVFVKGLKIGFIAFSVYDYTNNLLKEEKAKSTIERLSKKTDILIVSMHAGVEGDSAMHVRDKFEYFYGEKRGNVKKFAKMAIDNGADIVFGHGPHVIRGIEIYKERIIAYSLGNFACYGGFNLKYPRNISFILRVKVNKNGEFIEGEIIPLVLKYPGIPEYDKEETAVKLLKKLIKEDRLKGVRIKKNKIYKEGSRAVYRINEKGGRNVLDKNN